ncbi:MAG: ABC transporter ATP-binding protein [Thermoplasmata archaeon]
MELRAEKVSKTYGSKNYALKEVSFDIDLNGIFTIIGKNGAGKTTLIRISSTQLLPTSGKITVNGYDVVKNAESIREFIAAVPQEARAIPWLTPIQTVLSYLMWRGYSYREAKEKGKDALRSLGLGNVENEKNRKLSGGQKRKVLVATVIASEAPLIFLDEPTTGLDYLSRKELWNLLSTMKKDRLIILTTHYLEEAEILGDKIGILDQGKLIGIGNIDELRGKMKYPYSLKVYSDKLNITVDGGVIKKSANGETQVYTTKDQVYKIAMKLITENIRFTVQEVSLGNIFEFLVGDHIED